LDGDDLAANDRLNARVSVGFRSRRQDRSLSTGRRREADRLASSSSLGSGESAWRAATSMADLVERREIKSRREERDGNDALRPLGR